MGLPKDPLRPIERQRTLPRQRKQRERKTNQQRFLRLPEKARPGSNRQTASRRSPQRPKLVLPDLGAKLLRNGRPIHHRPGAPLQIHHLDGDPRLRSRRQDPHQRIRDLAFFF